MAQITYSPSPGDLLISGASAATERLPGLRWWAGCGEASLVVILNLVKGVGTSPAEVSAIIAQAQTFGAGAGGVSDPQELIATAQANGVQIMSLGWQQALNTYAGTRPIELGLTNAMALGGVDSTVSGHFITVVGRTADGNYIVSDPNSLQSMSGQFVVYSPQQIANALPDWAGVPSTGVFAPASPSNLAGGNTTGTAGIDWGSFWSGVWGVLGGVGGAATGQPGSSNGVDWVALGRMLGDVLSWLTNPFRMLKIIIGVALLLLVVAVAFFRSDAGQEILQQGQSYANGALTSALGAGAAAAAV